MQQNHDHESKTGLSAGPPRQVIDALHAEPELPTVKEAEFIVPLNIIIATIAVLVSIAALALNYYGDPLGRGLKAYDFSTPRAALESEAKIHLNLDYRAMMQQAAMMEGDKIKEKLKTLEVRKSAEWRGKVILFVKFREEGVTRNSTEAFEKDSRTGIWYPSYLSWSEVRGDNARLAKQMEDWTQKGELP